MIYKLMDYFKEILGEEIGSPMGTMREAKERARERYEDTNGKCDLAIIVLNAETCELIDLRVY